MMTARRAACGLVLLGSLALASCGDGRLKTYPTSGQVLYNGVPFKGATVAFHPVDKANDTGFPPNGKTDGEGKFTLTTYVKNDGCPAGEFKVAIAIEVESADEGSDQTKRLTFQMPAKYHRAETTPLNVTVKSGTNDVPPFKLEGPPAPKERR